MTSTVFETSTLAARAAVLSALGDPIRLAIVDTLADGQCCVCDLQKTVDVASNLLSYHLRVLREAGLIESQRRGRWIDYAIAPAARPQVRTALGPALGADAPHTEVP